MNDKYMAINIIGGIRYWCLTSLTNKGMSLIIIMVSDGTIRLNDC